MGDYNPTATTSIDNWDWQNRHVQRNLDQGNFISGKHILLCFGPPRLLQVGENSFAATGTVPGTDDVAQINQNSQLAFPVGITDSFTLRSDKQWRRIFEIGSDRAYMLPGHASYVGSLARVLYNGPSLLKCSYAFYGDRFNSTAKFDAEEPKVKADAAKYMPEVWEAPGHGDLFFNLASDLFDMTFGILAIFQDNKHNTVGSIYMEECAINGHSLNFDANSPLIVEGTSFTPNRVVPVHVNVELKVANRLVWSEGNAQ